MSKLKMCSENHDNEENERSENTLKTHLTLITTQATIMSQTERVTLRFPHFSSLLATSTGVEQTTGSGWCFHEWLSSPRW